MIFLDVDDVLADLVTRMCQVVGFNPAEWPAGVYLMSSVLGKDCWIKPEVLAPRFWHDLPKLPWADQVVEMCQEKSQVCFLTKPVQAENCAAGKIHWLSKHYPGIPYLIGPKKWPCAFQGSVLVDDNDDNVVDFDHHGGHGILFPRRHNSLHFVDDPVEYLREQLL